MPSNKRQRQREGREARREAARLAQKRAAQRRQILSIVLVVAVIAGIGLLLSRGGDDKAASPSTTTVPGDSTTTTTIETEPDPPGTAECPSADGSSERRTQFDGLPKTCIDPARSYTAAFETDAGSFTVALDAKKAPIAVNSFVFLSRFHYYDGVAFHRVIPGFVVQGGDGQKGDGTGGPGYKLKDELPAQGDYKIGSLAMANSGPDTAGSQFFVVTGDQGAGLPPSYTLFGTVTKGLDVVKKIEADGDTSGTPKVKHAVNKVLITES